MQEGNRSRQGNTEVNKAFFGDQVTQGRQSSAAFFALNGAKVDESNFEAQVRVPTEDTIDVAVRRRDVEDSPVVHIRLEIVKRNGGRFRGREVGWG
jgi:hypothetical protein